MESFYNVYSHSTALVKKMRNRITSMTLNFVGNVKGKFLFPLLHCVISAL